MSLFDIFPEINAGKRANQVFEDVSILKVVANKNSGSITIVVESSHLIDYRDIRDMEKALENSSLMGKKSGVKIDVKYTLSDVYTPETLWNMNKKNIMEEIKNTSTLLYGFVDGAEDSLRHSDNGEYTIIFKSTDSFINKNLSKELKTFLVEYFQKRFSFSVDVAFEWTEEKKKELPYEEYDFGDDYETVSGEKVTEHTAETKASKTKESKSDKKEVILSEKKEKSAGKDMKSSEADKKTENGKDRKSFIKGDYVSKFKSKVLKTRLEEDPEIFYGEAFDDESVVVTPIAEIDEGFKNIVIFGKIIKFEDPVQIRNRESFIVKFAVTDFTDTITCKLFLTKEELDSLKPELAEGKCIKLQGLPKYDTFEKEITISNITGIKSIPDFVKKRKDTSVLKRVELHAHTMMSDMDGVVDPAVLVKTAFDFGHPAVAITDHGVVQGFTDAFHYYRDKLKKSKDPEIAERAKNFKIIYGCEIYLVDDMHEFVKNDRGQKIDSTVVVFDLETTGLYANHDKIMEIGAVKLENNKIVDRFSTFVNPQVPIPSKIETKTHISDAMVANAPLIDDVLPKFLEFCGDSVLVGHNVGFDAGFIKADAERLGLPFEPTLADTIGISQGLLSGLKNYKLDTVANELSVSLVNHHRAVDDAECTANIYIKLCSIMNDKGISTLGEAKEKLKPSAEAIRNMHPFHCIVLIRNVQGRHNLYKMISKSHLEYFKKSPKIPKSLLAANRDGLIIGSACEQGELYRAILEDDPPEVIASLCEFYDYYEIQPLGNNYFMIEEEKLPQIQSEEDLKRINEEIVRLGEEYNKPVCATCDVHFLNPEDEVYRRLIMHSKGFKDADRQAPLFLRTTEEMLEEFSYLGSKKCKEVVIDNPNQINSLIENIDPVRPDKCPPVIENSEETLTQICHDKAHSMYGEELPPTVKNRLETELSSIIKNGYSVMYIIAQKLVWKSNEDGYLVGSRGSVGSSFVATMAGITEVNPLPAHYYCKKCKFSDFDSEEVKAYQREAICGFDMPDRKCPVCGEMLVKDGADIPFETFLGFNCDKEPDIDLNFSGEYQSKAHDYTEVIFGKGQTFKAGTVGTVAEKTAYGFALKYDEDHNLVHRRAELERMSKGCVGVRRSTGQHPGGIIVLPVGEDIDSFTPVQHPANDVTSNIVTTHFDYHSIDHNLLKLDILGHDDPTMIKRLEELTGVDAKTIPMDDKKVISLFHGTEALGITPEQIGGIDMGSLGLPELGTDNAMNMLRETKPDCFSDMVRISGLSHGTDVYANNAQVLIQNGTCNLKQAICTRDDIMLYLINKGVEPGHAFKIMESVRKGKGLTEEQETEMKEHDVPDWYIWSCKKIQYMFPKAHACAYIMMAFRVAWFKVYKPLAYYAAYFGIRAAAFDYKMMCLGKETLLRNMNEVKKRLDTHTGTAKDDTTYMNMKSVLEMYARGYEFMPIDLFRAKAHAFQIIDGKIMPSFDTIAGLGEKAADQLFEACKDGPFTSKESIKDRAHISQSAVDAMAELGLLGDLPETDQISFEDWLRA